HIEAAGGRFRGIRHSGARVDDPAIPVSRTKPPLGLYDTADFRAGATALAAMGLSFEAWQYHPQLADVAELAAAVPELSIVVNHLGGPLGVGRYENRRSEVMAEVKNGLELLVAFENVSVKLGGVGMTRFGTDWLPEDRPPDSDRVVEVWGDLLRWCIDSFGPSRCMFESNYPVDGETTSYTVLWNAFKKVSTGYSPTERADLFAGTARRVYRI
ncbi:MAG: amidohydrolase family protein, partial [Acidimicrobiales bacterium]